MEKKKINMKDVQKVVTSKNKNQSKNKISNSKKKGNSLNTKKKKTINANNIKEKNIVVSKETTTDIKSKNSNKEKGKLDSNLKKRTNSTKSQKNTSKVQEPLTPNEEKKIIKKNEQKTIEKTISNTNPKNKIEKRKPQKSKPQSHKQIKTKVDFTIVRDKKKKTINIIVILLFIICISGIIISASHIFTWKKENKEIKKQVTEIEQKSEVEEVPDSETVEVIKPVEEIDKANPYWDYIKMNLINVDFTELKQTNNEVVGWIQVNGTNINYPFVQTTNNDYYLSHAFNKSYNSAGWVFMDYRNNISGFNKNTVIYAHGRLDNTMFGSLKNIIKSSWIDNPNNYIIKLSTEYENTLWQVFSVYKIPTTNDYLKINFKDEEDFTNFANKLISRSEHNFNTVVSSTDKILTLSTCYDDTDKVVLHAKLIKREAK